MSLVAEIPADPSGEKNPRNESAPVQDIHLLGKGSPGVRRIEVITSHFRPIDRVFLFLAIFLIAYVYGLDGTVRYTYQVRYRDSHELTMREIINLFSFFLGVAIRNPELQSAQLACDDQRSTSGHCCCRPAYRRQNC